MIRKTLIAHRRITLLLVLFFILNQFCILGQPVPEHVYVGFEMTREWHPSYGSVYHNMYFENSEKRFKAFDSTHQIIQNTLITPPAGWLNQPKPNLITNNFFDDDPGYEFVTVLKTGINGDFSSICLFDDDGSIITGPVIVEEEAWVSKDISSLRMVSFADGTKHLWADNNVYLVPDLSFIQSFDPQTPLDGNGVSPFYSTTQDTKYGYANEVGLVKLYNADFSTFQEVQLEDTTYNDCDYFGRFLDQYSINPNEEVEFLLKNFCWGADEYLVYSGNNLLYKIEDIGHSHEYFIWPQNMPGITKPKLIINNIEVSSKSGKVYDLTTGLLEHYNPDQNLYPFSNGSSIGLLLHTEQYTPSTSYPVYDVQYNIVTTMNRPAHELAVVKGISNTAFDDDPDTYEAIEIYQKYDEQGWHLSIYNNYGTELMELDSVVRAFVSRIDGSSNKLIVNRGQYSTKRIEIYTLPFDSIAVSAMEQGHPNQILLWPNPVANHLFIDPQTFPSNSADVRILDPLGRIVWLQQVNTPGVIEVDAQGWPAGLYIVQVVSGGKTTSRTVMKQP